MQLVDNIDDFIRYYQGSYIAERNRNGKMVPYYVQGIVGINVDLRASRMEREATTFTDILERFKLSCPRVGAISTGQGLLYISIVPERQYKKGLCGTRLDTHNFCRELGTDAVMSWTLADWIFNNKYFQPEVLLEKIKRGERLGGAISYKMGIHIKPTLKNPLITYKDYVVGSIVGDQVHVLEKFKAYEDYIIRTIPSHKYVSWSKKN